MSGAAVRTTVVPVGNVALHRAKPSPQSMPAGTLVTRPPLMPKAGFPGRPFTAWPFWTATANVFSATPSAPVLFAPEPLPPIQPATTSALASATVLEMRRMWCSPSSFCRLPRALRGRKVAKPRCPPRLRGLLHTNVPV